MNTIDRTLVMSPPEVWQLVSDPERARAWMAALGAPPEAEIACHSDPERSVAWEASGERPCRLELQVAEKGWGTNVTVSAEAGGDVEGVLEQLLEELASPERRPFSAGV